MPHHQISQAEYIHTYIHFFKVLCPFKNSLIVKKKWTLFAFYRFVERMQSCLSSLILLQIIVESIIEFFSSGLAYI